MNVESYYTVSDPVKEVLIKEKGSRFIGFAFGVNRLDQIKGFLSELKKEHKQAGHFCYAYRILNKEGVLERYSDDGEPNYSAGLPIYQQIVDVDMHNVLVVVVRYFGGIKLGVGGLIRAYKSCAEKTLSSTERVLKKIKQCFAVEVSYQNFHELMKIIDQTKANILSQKMEVICVVNVEVEIGKVQQFLFKLNSIKGIKFSSEC